MQIQKPLFLTLWMLLLPSSALFAGASDDSSVTNSPMLRQGAVTKGYEPLPVGEQTIAAAYLPQTLGIPRGAVLLLHDINEHIDSAAIGLLRRQLPGYGWNTLAIKIIRFSEDNETALPATETEDATTTMDGQTQPEAAEPSATEAENVPVEDAETLDATEAVEKTFKVITTSQRIDAALLKLQQEGHENIVLIGQGAGGELALKTLRETAVPVAALIMINTDELASENSMTDTTIPILEIMGSRQKDAVKQAILKRQTQMKTEQRNNYHLRQIIGADHYFSSVPLQLTNQIHGWLYSQLLDEEASR